MTREDINHKNMIKLWYYSLNMSKNVCVYASYAKVCKLGQNVKKKIKKKKKNIII